MTKALIPAATILLLRDSPAFEVLMVERHADIAFAGGAMVFPGGRIDPGDRMSAWLDHCDGVGNIDTDQIAPRIAAIREAFEETGIILARNEKGMVGAEFTTKLGNLRSQVEDDDAKFLEMIQEYQLRLALDQLHLFARWQPPAAAKHKRFDTWFFAATAPHDQVASPDGSEATEVIWTSPEHILADRDVGKRKMIFPTSRNVELLGQSDSVDAVFEFAKSRIIRPIEPTVITNERGTFVSIPDDLGYPITQEHIDTAQRH